MLTLIWYLVMLYISINLFQSLRVGYCCCCQLDYRTLSSEPLPPTHVTSTITSKSTMTNTSQTTRATAATTSWYLKFLVTYIHCPHDFWLQQPNAWDHRFCPRNWLSCWQDPITFNLDLSMYLPKPLPLLILTLWNNSWFLIYPLHNVLHYFSPLCS